MQCFCYCFGSLRCGHALLISSGMPLLTTTLQYHAVAAAIHALVLLHGVSGGCPETWWHNHMSCSLPFTRSLVNAADAL